MKKIKLSKYEHSIEDEIDRYVPVSRQKLEKFKKALKVRRKDAVLNARPLKPHKQAF